MAIYHLSVSICGRSNGQSAVASAAYISGECLVDQETGKRCDYRYKKEVVYSEIFLPKNAPDDFKDRATLWNEVQREEKGKKARFARKIDVAIAIEIKDRQMQIDLAREFSRKFVDEGMCVDIAIHDKGDGNPHIHMMLTTRAFKDDGSWAAKTTTRFVVDENGDRIPLLDRHGNQKVDKRDGCLQWKRETVDTVDWNKREKVEEWRDAWEKVCNRYLDKVDAGVTIDHRSYERQAADTGVEPKIPTIHEGAAARRMEARGEISDRLEINRMVMKHRSLVDKIRDLTTEIKDLIAQKFRMIFGKEDSDDDAKADISTDRTARHGDAVGVDGSDRVDAGLDREEGRTALRMRLHALSGRAADERIDFISGRIDAGADRKNKVDEGGDGVDREPDPVDVGRDPVD